VDTLAALLLGHLLSCSFDRNSYFLGRFFLFFDTIPENAKRESLRRSDTLFLRRTVRQYTRQLDCLAIQRPSA
jgi:hypothetical protein